jgi:hypothetical protein
LSVCEYNETHDSSGKFSSAGSGAAASTSTSSVKSPDGFSSGHIPTHAELSKTAANDSNYKKFLMKDPAKGEIGLVDYVAAKQLHAYHDRGDILPIRDAADFFWSSRGK